MNYICLDFEGTLGPEVWTELAAVTNIKELERTTMHEPDYNVLMQERINILRRNRITVSDIQNIVENLDLLDGALDFFKQLQSRGHMPIIVTGSFYEYILPLTNKLGSPTVFANSLNIDSEGYISDFTYMAKDQKRQVVQKLRDLNLKVIAAGDSYNDLPMIEEADLGMLLFAGDQILRTHPEITSCNSYAEVLELIDSFTSS